MGAFRVLIYSIIFLSWFGSLAYDVLYMPRLPDSFWIRKLVFMTMINFTLQTVYFGLCVVCAIVDSRKELAGRGPHTRHPALPSYWRNSPLHRVADFVYATSAFPLGFATSIMFWGLYIVDPRLVVPAWAEAIIPRWYNHMTHTAPIPFLLVDTILTCHHFPDRALGLTTSVLLVFFYIVVVCVARVFDGMWLYPVLDYLTAMQRLLLFLVAAMLYCCLYLLGDLLNSMLWGKAAHAIPTKQGKQR